jgi:hypothetical protein
MQNRNQHERKDRRARRRKSKKSSQLPSSYRAATGRDRKPGAAVAGADAARYALIPQEKRDNKFDTFEAPRGRV